MDFRNLRALSDWQWKQRNSTPKVFEDRSKIFKSEPPYAVYSEYSKTPSREDLAKQLDNFIKNEELTPSKRSKGNKMFLIEFFFLTQVIMKS